MSYNYLTEIPVNNNTVNTVRSLSLEHPDNGFLRGFKEEADLHELEDLLNEVIIRFDTNPDNYLKDDYMHLIALLYRNFLIIKGFNDRVDGVDDIIVGGAVSTTYSDLYNKYITSLLSPGTFYRITDYNCTTAQSSTQSANHAFDIIVVALSENTLSELAWAVRNLNDTYFPETTKFEAWELKYTIKNDVERFGWADSTSGKGVVYFMKDEFGNEAGYDFKNILFYDSNNSKYMYTFTMNVDGAVIDSSLLDVNFVNNNIIKSNRMYGDWGSSIGSILASNIAGSTAHSPNLYEIYYLPRNIFYGTGIVNNFLDTDCFANTFSAFVKEAGCTSTGKIENIKLGHQCTYNVFTSECSNIKLGNLNQSNTFIISATCKFGDGNYLNYVSSENLIFGNLNRYIKIGDFYSKINNIIIADNNAYVNISDSYSKGFIKIGSLNNGLSIINSDNLTIGNNNGCKSYVSYNTDSSQYEIKFANCVDLTFGNNNNTINLTSCCGQFGSNNNSVKLVCFTGNFGDDNQIVILNHTSSVYGKVGDYSTIGTRNKFIYVESSYDYIAKGLTFTLGNDNSLIIIKCGPNGVKIGDGNNNIGLNQIYSALLLEIGSHCAFITNSLNTVNGYLYDNRSILASGIASFNKDLNSLSGFVFLASNTYVKFEDYCYVLLNGGTIPCYTSEWSETSSGGISCTVSYRYIENLIIKDRVSYIMFRGDSTAYIKNLVLNDYVGGAVYNEAGDRESYFTIIDSSIYGDREYRTVLNTKGIVTETI